MALQNRVDPFGEPIATPARGTMFGNRGGRVHRDDRTLGQRRWASRQWICCVLQFKGRHRAVWRGGYTELFFLDEATALAAGHRPCFECRRRDALAFRAAWARARGGPPPPPAAGAGPPRGPPPPARGMGRGLPGEPLDGRGQRRPPLPSALPDGAMIAD